MDRVRTRGHVDANRWRGLSCAPFSGTHTASLMFFAYPRPPSHYPLAMIWTHPYSVAEVAQTVRAMPAHLGMEIVEVGADFLRGRMPVDDRTRQLHGILHGGASVALAETLGSIAATLVVDRARFTCVGQEINANHLRAVSSGWVTGTARPVHLGRRSHVWEIRITDEADRLVCISRLTMAVLERAE